MQESNVVINQWLKSIKGIGNRWITKLREEFTSEEILRMTYKELVEYSKNEKLFTDNICPGATASLQIANGIFRFVRWRKIKKLL